jgi:radical SAM protein with 4Fe4S-binding SPASM domain
MLFEFFLILKKTSTKKIRNALKLYTGYFISLLLKKPRRNAFPVSISIEPLSLCNLSCPECSIGSQPSDRNIGKINSAVYRRIIDELSPVLFNLSLYFQGEPFLNDTLFEMIEYASVQKKIHTVTSTNGHFLSVENCEKTVKSGLDKLIISLDGTTPEVYKMYRKNGNFETVIQGIKNMVMAKVLLKKKTPIIVLQFIVFRFNEHQIDDIKKLSKQLNVDRLSIKTAQVYHFENDTTYIPTANKYARYKRNREGIYQIKSKLNNMCLRLYESSVITSTGEVLPCCFDKTAGHSFGNIQTNDFKAINNSPNALNFRRAVLTKRNEMDICKNCSSGLIT